MSLGVSEIDSIELAEAFPGNDGYANLEECWSSSQNSEIIVIDNDARVCQFSTEPEVDRHRGLLLVNNSNHNIILLMIDNKLISNKPGGIADCAVFDMFQFLFVEFKTNALGHSQPAIEETFDKAISQLTETIKLFRKRAEKIFSYRKIMCHIITNHSFPRANAMKQNYIYSFWQENGLELSFESKHDF